MQAVDFAAIRINGETIGLSELFARARARGQMSFVDDAINTALLRDAAQQLGIEVTKQEAQDAANAFREKHQLLKAEDAMRWLNERGLTVADWQNMLEEDVLIAKFKSARFESKIPTYFAERKLDFDRATIGRIVVSNESLASELALQLREEGAVFEDVARKHSVDPLTKEVGGYFGKVRRKDLVAAASSAVFGGAASTVHGPFKVGKEWHIFRTISLHPATLDDETKEQIKDRMYNDWLADTRAKAHIEMPMFEVGK